jgi:hypothetical protein
MVALMPRPNQRQQNLCIQQPIIHSSFLSPGEIAGKSIGASSTGMSFTIRTPKRNFAPRRISSDAAFPNETSWFAAYA